jgi:putative ABC transport system permease protein
MSARLNIKPPHWADRFLQWYCRKDLLEGIQGDAYELFYRRADNNSSFNAKRLFIWDVLRFFRPSNIRKTQNSNNTAMIKNYFKLGFRSLLRNKVAAAINIIGLSISIGIAITTFMFVDYYLNIDSFHKNLNEIYYIQSDINLSTGTQRNGTTPAPLRDVLAAEEPSIENVVRIIDKDGIIRYGDQVYYERFRFADPQFLKMFTFPLAYGSKEIAYDKSRVILSKKVAERFFGQEIAISKMISIIIDGERREYEVGGVAEKFPESASFSFGVLIPFESQVGWIEADYTDWSKIVYGTFVQLKKGASTDGCEQTLDTTVPIQNDANPERPVIKYHMEPLSTASRNGYAVYNNILFGNHPAGVFGALLMAVLLLALTCINYTNIAVSSTAGRLKEIALRKVIGGNRKELVFQFLIENLILVTIALILGIALTEFILLPGFNSSVPVTFPFVLAPRFWVFILLLLVLTSLASGAYPALYISKFQPVEIFRGKEKFGKSIFSKVMLTIQFAIALNLIISAFIFRQTEEYQKNLDWGYTEEQKIVLPVEDHEQYRKLADAMALNPDVNQITGAKNHFGKSTQRSTIVYDEEQYEVRLMEASPDYLNLMGVNLLAGDFFKEDKESDYLESVIINETFMETLGWDSWETKVITYDSNKYHVIGLVQDFHYHSFYTKIYPAFFKSVKEEQLRYVVAGINPGRAVATEEYSRKVWKEILPDLPYAGFFQDTVFDFFFEETKANAGLMKFLGAVAIILSCMGLYGLVSFNISKRMKEFSLRKIMGAGGWTIFKQINKGFIIVLLVAILLAAPLTYMLMSNLIASIYEYYEPINITSFGLAFGVLLLTVFLTVSLQIFKVFKANPIDALRDE